MIEFRDVTYGFAPKISAVKILNGISFKIAKGEKVALLGLNGSGKTTLLKLAALLCKPDNGEVLIDSISATVDKQIEKLRKSIGFFFQNPNDQIITAKVESEIVFTMENLGFPRPEMKTALEEITEKFEIGDLLDRHPASLSGGERQRVVLASVLVVDPEILLLDEPGSFLDHPGKQYLSELIFAENNKTIIAATQYPEEALNYDRLIFLEDGKISYDGQPQSFFESELWLKQNKELVKKNKTESDNIQFSNSKNKPLVKMKNVSFSYDSENELLKNINIEINPSKIIGIVGNSASGKTTLAMLLAGLRQPQNGKIEYLNDKPAICFQFPEDQFFAETLFDEVAFALKNKNLDTEIITDSVERAFENIGLNYNQFKQRSPFKLSGGEKRLAAIASILIMQRNLVIFDEPTAGLDWLNKEKLIRHIYQLKCQGIGIVLISHDLDLIMRLTDHLVILEKGQIIWQGDKFSNKLPLDKITALFGDLPKSYKLLEKLILAEQSKKQIEKELLNMIVL